MAIDNIFNDGNIDGVADNIFGAVNNSVSEVKLMQQRKAAENVQLVINALKKIESDIKDRFDNVGSAIEKRVLTIKDGRNGIDGTDGRDGKDGKPGRDGQVGPKGRDGLNGRDGIDGQDGVSVTNAHLDFDGSLVITLSNGTEIDVGEVMPMDLAEKIKIVSNGGGTSQYVVDTLASLQTQISALIPSQTGNSGKYLTTDGTTTSWGTVSGGGSMTYPGAGIPLSTGSAWGTSYPTTGATSVVLRDSSQNVSANSFLSNFTNVAAAGTTTTLTVSSSTKYVVTGSGGQTYQLPSGTTLANGAVFSFNNNQSSGAVTVTNNASTTIATVQSGGFVEITLLSNATTAGSWDVHVQAPSNVTWSTNTFDYAGSITSATWNGVAVAANRGGTGVANNSASTITISGNFGTTFTVTGTTAVTLPTSGTLVNTAVTTLSSLTSVGTIGTGVWNGTIITGTYGGTGVNNGSKTITLGGNLTTSGAFNTTVTTTATTAVTLPTSGTLISSVTALSGAVTGTPSSSTYLRGDGTWSSVSAGAAGSTTQVQYNSSGALAGSASFIFDGTNVGVGVTPSANQFGNNLQVNQTILNDDGAGTNHLTKNAYYSSGWKYISTDYASKYTQSLGVHSWSTAPSGTAGGTITFTQAMTLNASGFLGIGVTNPTWGVDISNSTGAGFRYKSTSGSGTIAIDSTGTGAGGSGISCRKNGTAYALFGVSGWINGDTTTDAQIFADGSSGIRFCVAGSVTPSATIDSSGNLLVGTTTSLYSARFTASSSNTCAGLITTTSAEYCLSAVNTASSGNNNLILFQTDSTPTTRGSITYNRSGGLVVYNTTSDYRAKTVNGLVQNALSKIALLKPSTGRMNGATEDIDFFVAHELQEVVPFAVIGEKDAVNEDNTPKYQMVDKSALIPLLTAAIQEQQAIIESLLARLTALENK